MTQQRVVIVGGGLSGLYSACLLAEAGIDFTLFEARDRLGGRILSASARDEFDLGPSWFWPDFQPRMMALVDHLGLPVFSQPVDGDMLVERFRLEPPQRLAGYLAGNESLRIAGGTGALISALAAKLAPGRVQTGRRVTSVTRLERGVVVSTESSAGDTAEQLFSAVIFALPPRLMAAHIGFEPGIDPLDRQHWATTPTWMAPHAKYVAVFDKAFWRDHGLSGMAQSMVGPLVEIHDASSQAGEAALFGFIGITAQSRQALGDAMLSQQCRAQLVRLFGAQAAQPRAEFFKDWAADSLTATAADQESGAHGHGGGQSWVVRGDWAPYLHLAGSEVANEHSGYMEGALEAAQWAVSHWRQLTEADKRNHSPLKPPGGLP
ncbi:flavin monoamine oxidase family protein [Pseudomonas azerbaijanoccidentalis]